MQKSAQSQSGNEERLADVLSRMLALSQDRQNSVNEYSHFLEMKWMADTNPEVQAARSMPSQDREGDDGKNNVETEAYGLVLGALEDLLSDVTNMSQSIENRLERDTRDVETLSGRVTVLNARIRSIAERKVKRKTDSQTTAKPHEPKLLPLWTPMVTPKLSSKANVFHRRALVSRLVTGVYYDEFKTGNEEEQALEEEIKEQQEEIRRETQLSHELEAMALEAAEMAEAGSETAAVAAAVEMPDTPFTPFVRE